MMLSCRLVVRLEERHDRIDDLLRIFWVSLVERRDKACQPECAVERIARERAFAFFIVASRPRKKLFEGGIVFYPEIFSRELGCAEIFKMVVQRTFGHVDAKGTAP